MVEYCSPKDKESYAYCYCDTDRKRDAQVLSGLCDEHDHRQGAARCPRRPQARTPQDPLRHVRAEQYARQAVQEVCQGRRRRYRQVPSARRPGGLRRHHQDGAGLLHEVPPHRRPGQLRLHRRRCPGCHALHGGAPLKDRRGDTGRHREGHRRFQGKLRRVPERAHRNALAHPQPADKRLVRHRGRHGHQYPAPQPDRGGERHDSLHRQTGYHHPRIDGAYTRPRFPHAGINLRQEGHQGRLRDRARPHTPAGDHEHREGEEGRPGIDHHHAASLPGEQGAPHREHRRARQPEEDRGHIEHPRRVEPGRHPGRHRVKAE